MKNKLHKTKECYNCGFVIIQSTDSWSGGGDKNDPHMSLTTCPYCGNEFCEGEVVKELDCATKLREKIYEEHIKGDPEKEKLYQLQIPFYEKWDDDEFEKQFPKQPKSEYEPKCPTCGSTHVHKISGLDRAASVMLFGIFSKKINKSFKCDNCGYTW